MPGAIADAKSWIRKTMNRRIGVSSVGELLFVVIRAVLLIGMCYIIVFPMVSKISSSFMSGEDIYDNTVRWIPRRPTLNNYRDAFYEMEYGWALLRSLALAVAVGTLSLMSCTLVGYGLARYRFPGRELIFAGAILTLVIPPSLLMIPIHELQVLQPLRAAAGTRRELAQQLLAVSHDCGHCDGLEKRPVHLYHAAVLLRHAEEPRGSSLHRWGRADPDVLLRDASVRSARPDDRLPVLVRVAVE